MACENVFYNEDYYDFLTEYGAIGGSVKDLFQTDCTYPINNRITSFFLEQQQNQPVPYEQMSFSMIPKCYGLMDAEALQETGVWQVQSGPLELTGQNVMIGFVDTGIDYNNPIFRYEDGRSKIHSIWDQSIPSKMPQEGVYYGTIYDREQIEQAVASENPYEVVSSRDENGHGTFLAGIAAGRAVEEEEFYGAAPDAEIVVVKLKEAKQNLRDYYLIDKEVEAYSEIDLIFGVEFLITQAYEAQKPLVICLGVGSNHGSHTGSTFLGDYLNFISVRRGVSIVVAAGNEGSARSHYHGVIRDEQETVELRVGEKESGFSMELWGKAPYRFRIQIESPSGQKTEWIDAGIRGNRSFQFLFERTQVYIDYLIVDPYSGEQGIIFRFSNPSEGIWKIRVEETQTGEKPFDVWLPIQEFIDENTFFLESSPYITVTTPADAGNVISIAAYETSTGAIYLESSRGYTGNQLIKPDFAVPGVGLLGPAKGNRFGRKSGTSVAAALMAGMVALFFQWAIGEENDPWISTTGVKSYFIRGAERDENRSYPNREWGYGKANLYRVFLEIR